MQWFGIATVKVNWRINMYSYHGGKYPKSDSCNSCVQSLFPKKVLFLLFFYRKNISYIFCLQRALLHILCFILCMYGCGQNKKLLHFLDICADYCSQENITTLHHAVLNGNNVGQWVPVFTLQYLVRIIAYEKEYEKSNWAFKVIYLYIFLMDYRNEVVYVIKTTLKSNVFPWQ